MRTIVFVLSMMSVSASSAQEHQDNISKRNQLDLVAWSKMGLNSLERFNSQYDYAITDTIQFKKVQVLVIERLYLEEHYQWMCIFSGDRVVDALVTTYGNSEGSLSVSSTTEKNHLKIYTSNSVQIPS